MSRLKKNVPSICSVTLSKRRKSQSEEIGSSIGRKGRSGYSAKGPLLRYMVFRLRLLPSSQSTTNSESCNLAASDMQVDQWGQVSLRIVNNWRVSIVSTSASNSGDSCPSMRRGNEFTPRSSSSQLSHFVLLSPPS